MITIEQIKKVIKDRIETLEPADTILRILRESHGKRLDKRIIDKMNMSCPEWRIVDKRQFKMTQIAWMTYTMPYQSGGSLLIAHKENDVYIDSQDIYNRNPAYFEFRDKRNKQRKELLEQDDKFFQNIVDPMNEFIKAQQSLSIIFDHVESFPFPDFYEVKKLVKKCQPNNWDI